MNPVQVKASKRERKAANCTRVTNRFGVKVDAEVPVVTPFS
jgi:hypothetical protein